MVCRLSDLKRHLEARDVAEGPEARFTIIGGNKGVHIRAHLDARDVDLHLAANPGIGRQEFTTRLTGRRGGDQERDTVQVRRADLGGRSPVQPRVRRDEREVLLTCSRG